MTKIIFFNGPPFSGKDTCARLLQEKVQRFAFADRLKWMFCQAHGFEKFPEGKEKDHPMPEPYQDKTWRQGVIAFSENYMKPAFGQDIFGKLLLKEMLFYESTSFSPKKVFGITDSGFAEEGKVLTQHYGRKNCCVVQLHRPGRTFLGDSRSYLVHEDIGADFTIFLHNTGSLDFLKSELLILDKWMES